MGKDCESLQKVVHASLKACGMGNIPTLAANITVGGGNTTMKGYCERLQKEVQKLVAQSVTTKVWGGEDQIRRVWMGGSTLSQMCDNYGMWISQDDYGEHGVNSVTMKCQL